MRDLHSRDCHRVQQRLRIIDLRPLDTQTELLRLRATLSPRGAVLSESARRKTQEVFGAELAPRDAVARICEDVRGQGWEAVAKYTQAFDGVTLRSDQVRVPREAMQSAHAAAESGYLESLRSVRTRIEQFQRSILSQDVELQPALGVRLSQHYRPIRRVGICVPGGAAAYPSTLLMTVVPAQVAGVPEIVVVAPPTPFGADNPDIRTACCELGVRELYRLGGAQAVAALAYGLEQLLPPVDLIVGPGNLFVALAKQYVFGDVGIDSLAGPSEVVVIADETATVDHVAAELLAQAEHAPGSSLLLVWDSELATRVNRALETQLGGLSRVDLVSHSLTYYGAILLVRDSTHAIQVANELAPEHLQLSVRNPRELAEQITTSGAIFLGHMTPVAVGDYLAGPSHVLPTGGSGRWSSGLSANTFRRSHAWIEYSEEALRREGKIVEGLAAREQLTAHAASIRIRTENQPSA